jgi:nucleoside 2-deoxyribosyltransferase
MKPKPFTVYIAGKMSGLKEYGFDKFNEAADVLRNLGVVVINPAETGGGVKHLPREVYFRYDFAVINVCDAVVVLPNWTQSRGAKAEVIYATEIGLPVIEYHHKRGLGRLVHIEKWRISHRNGPWVKLDELGIIGEEDV